MNYFVLIIVGVAGVLVGRYLGRKMTASRGDSNLINSQMKEKADNKEKILGFLRERGRIRNNDVERLVMVSDATAERYLNELEKAGKITQHGQSGQGVYYTFK
jgi:predicted HTH transcriptional regulator